MSLQGAVTRLGLTGVPRAAYSGADTGARTDELGLGDTFAGLTAGDVSIAETLGLGFAFSARSATLVQYRVYDVRPMRREFSLRPVRRVFDVK